jgi:hypothetical protein
MSLSYSGNLQVVVKILHNCKFIMLKFSPDSLNFATNLLGAELHGADTFFSTSWPLSYSGNSQLLWEQTAHQLLTQDPIWTFFRVPSVPFTPSLPFQLVTTRRPAITCYLPGRRFLHFMHTVNVCEKTDVVLYLVSTCCLANTQLHFTAFCFKIFYVKTDLFTRSMCITTGSPDS